MSRCLSPCLQRPVSSSGSLPPFWFGPLLHRLAQPGGNGGSNGRHPADPQQTPSENLPYSLHLHLRICLLGLSVRAYERLIARLLQAAGYQEVRVLRDHRLKRRSHKGRTAHGGIDITAQSNSGLSISLLLVQVKQYRRPVSRRFVDELRGALLRTHGQHGLLITTSRFAPAARQAALEDHVGPIRLIDGEKLIELLVRHRLGVRETRGGHLTLNRRFFRQLEHEHLEQPEP